MRKIIEQVIAAQSDTFAAALIDAYCVGHNYRPEAHASAAMLLASLRVGPDVERAIGLAGIDHAAGLTVARRLYAHGIWGYDGTVDGDAWSDEDDFVSLLAWESDVMVGAGLLKRTESDVRFAPTELGRRALAQAIMNEVS